LASDAPDAIEQFFLLFDCVSHKKVSLGALQVYPGGYILSMT
jgi:hypothetical protein